MMPITLSNCGVGIGTYKLTGATCSDIVCNALIMGYRMIDTAVLYKNHSDIKLAIEKSGISRNNIYISSKIHDNTQKEQNDNNNAIRDSVMSILKELGTDYLDQLLLHSPVKHKFIPSWKILEELYNEKIIRFIGVSNFRIHELELLLQNCKIPPYVNQIELSPFCTRNSLVSFCSSHGIIVQAYASLTVGRRLNDANLIAIAQSLNISPASLLLSWALHKNYYIIPKADNIKHLYENINVSSIKLDNSVIENLDALNECYYTIKKHSD